MAAPSGQLSKGTTKSLEYPWDSLGLPVVSHESRVGPTCVGDNTKFAPYDPTVTKAIHNRTCVIYLKHTPNYPKHIKDLLEKKKTEPLKINIAEVGATSRDPRAPGGGQGPQMN